MKILESFKKLLDTLKTDGVITESTHGQLLAEATTILKEEGEGGDISVTIKKAVSDALSAETKKYEETIENLKKELDEAKKGKKKDEEPPPEEKTDGVEDDKKPKAKTAEPPDDGESHPEAKEGDLPPDTELPPEGEEEQEETGEEDENEEEPEMVKISDALTDFAKNWPEEALEIFNQLTETFTDEQEELIKSLLEMEMPKTCAEEEAEEFAAAAGKTAAEIKSTLDDEGQTTFEAIQKKNLFTEARGHGKLETLYLKKQKAEEALLQKQIKALSKQNRRFKMTGGVLGQTDRTNYFGDILKGTSKKLAMAESTAAKLESENAVLNERVTDLVSENDRIVVENKALKIEKKTLSERVETTSKSLILTEAKAYLVENSRGLTEPLKEHLLRELGGRPVEYVKRHLNEAVEAFDRSEDKRRSEIVSKRQPVDRTGKNLVTEATEQHEDEGIDPAVAAITALCGTFDTNLKQR